MDNQEKVQNDTVKKKNSKNILLIILILLILVGIAVGIAVLVSGKKEDKPQETTKKANNGYDSNIILDKDDVGKEEETVEKGKMNLKMKNVAASSDGENFTCFLCNSEANTLDMFITIKDFQSGEEIYKSGIIPVGARIEKFKTNKTLAEGTYNYVITFHQVEDDGVTEHASVSVAYTLNVN